MGSGQAKMKRKAAALSAGSVQTVLQPHCQQRKQGKWIPSLPSVPGSYRLDAHVLGKYNVKTVISKGRFGRVLRVENKLSKQLYAVKIIETEVDPRVENELAVLRRVRHPNVVRLDEVFRVGCRVYMVMELATGGSLQEKLEKHSPFVEADAARVIRMLTSGLAHLHGLGIAHRNLQPETVLYEHDGSGAKVLITELGLASAPMPGREAYMHTVCEGKIRYMAPEMVARRPYTRAVDMWALGVIACILLTGMLPFDARSDAAVVQLIIGSQFTIAPEAWEHVSDHAQSVVGQLLKNNPEHRPSAAQLLEHPWFAAATTARMVSAPPQVRVRRVAAPFLLSMGQRMLVGGSKQFLAGRINLQLDPFDDSHVF